MDPYLIIGKLYVALTETQAIVAKLTEENQVFKAQLLSSIRVREAEAEAEKNDEVSN